MFIDDETLIHYLQGNERLRQQKQFLFFRFKIDVKRKLVAFRVCIFEEGIHFWNFLLSS